MILFQHQTLSFILALSDLKNIAKVMSPNTIHLHADVFMHLGPRLHTITPATGWDTKNSHTHCGVWGLGFMGPRDAERPPTLNRTLISHTVFSRHPHCFDHLSSLSLLVETSMATPGMVCWISSQKQCLAIMWRPKGKRRPWPMLKKKH